MLFLTNEDFISSIRGEDLDRLTDSDQTVLDAAELTAITLVNTELSARFDIDADLGKVGINRSQQLIDWLVDATIYRLYYRISPRNISEAVQDRYDLALEQIRAVLKNEANPVGLTPKLDEDGEEINFAIIQTGTPNAYRTDY